MKVFADTFYWIALTDSTGAAHKRAKLVTDDLVTTDEVLTEYACHRKSTRLLRKKSRQTFAQSRSDEYFASDNLIRIVFEIRKYKTLPSR